MGLGHVFRSLALAQMLIEDFDCYFIIRDPLPSLSIKIAAVCKEIVIPSTIAVESEAKYLSNTYFSEADIVVLDGYHFDTSYQQSIKEKNTLLVCIDDIHQYHFVSDMLINHAGGISSNDYSTELYTHMLLGPKYVLLRPEFDTVKSLDATDEHSCLVCMGGADPNNDTSTIVKECVASGKFSQLDIVIGAGYLFDVQLRQEIENYSIPINIHQQIEAEEMVSLMRQNNYAVTPPSTVAYEYLSQGGILFLHMIADNQKDLLSYFIDNKLAIQYNHTFEVSDQLTTTLLDNQRQIFDGRHTNRLQNAFRFLSSEIRLANIDDVNIVFDWANDPMVRNNSYQSAEIPYEGHVQWFSEKIKSADCEYYILQWREKLVGQIRFDIEENTAKINYTISSEFRGKGMSAILLRKGIYRLLKSRSDLQIVGYVKRDNMASVSSFRSLGIFNEEVVEALDSYRFIYRNEI